MDWNARGSTHLAVHAVDEVNIIGHYSGFNSAGYGLVLGLRMMRTILLFNPKTLFTVSRDQARKCAVGGGGGVHIRVKGVDGIIAVV